MEMIGDGWDWFKLEHPGGHMVWWDGYEGQSLLILDDFTGWIPLTQLLNILDGYPMTLNVKNGRTMANWTTVVITSNLHPRDWYSKDVMAHHDHGRALKRRIDELWEVFSEENIEEAEW